MPILINTESITADVWHRYVGSADSLPGQHPCLLPIEEWIERPSIWRQFASKIGVILAPSDDPARLVGRLDELAIIAMEFAAANDGQGIKHGIQLRQELGYSGTIRALGPVSPGQVRQLAKAGFNEFELADESQAGAALETLRVNA